MSWIPVMAFSARRGVLLFAPVIALVYWAWKAASFDFWSVCRLHAHPTAP